MKLKSIPFVAKAWFLIIVVSAAIASLFSLDAALVVLILGAVNGLIGYVGRERF